MVSTLIYYQLPIVHVTSWSASLHLYINIYTLVIYVLSLYRLIATNTRPLFNMKILSLRRRSAVKLYRRWRHKRNDSVDMYIFWSFVLTNDFIIHAVLLFNLFRRFVLIHMHTIMPPLYIHLSIYIYIYKVNLCFLRKV